MKRKVLLFGMNELEIQHLAMFPGSTEVDLIAATNHQQLLDTACVATPDCVVAWISNETVKSLGAALASMVLVADKLVVFNCSSYNASQLSQLFGKLPMRVFEQHEEIQYWNFMLSRITQWRNEYYARQGFKRVLLIDNNPLMSRNLSKLLHRYSVEVVCIDPAGAEDGLYEQVYDLVIARAESPDSTGFATYYYGNRGFNKNTPFVFYSETKRHSYQLPEVYNYGEEFDQLEVCVKKHCAA